MEGLGVLLFFGGGLALLVGFIMLLVGAIENSKPKLKSGAIVLLSATLALLISFSLCTSHL